MLALLFALVLAQPPPAVADAMGTCGDHAVALGEECDDGNHDDGDGCSRGCLREAEPTPRWVSGGLAFMGSAMAITGTALAMTGAVSAYDSVRLRNELGAAEALPAGTDTDRQAENLRAQLADAEQRWQDSGVVLAVGGAAALLVGVGAAAAGLALWTEPPPDEAAGAEAGDLEAIGQSATGISPFSPPKPAPSG